MVTNSPFTVSSETARARLLDLIGELAVVHQRVTLSSGKEADFYIDLRRITLHHEAAPLVGRVMLDLFESQGLLGTVEAVGGLTLGADPVATSIMHASAALSAAGSLTGDPLDAFVVRKANKAHGLQRRIEGPGVQGRPVIAVEDTSTTGGSVLTATEALEQEGADIRAVAVIMHRSEESRRAVTDAGYDYIYAYELSELGL
ncbi:orotate phosphoribosyltransferase [Helcobacillus massiliensis]|uniref:Orotate phosphoribosyltransferase n=1 Tax=Helcobacillus massiliensis TaxID=521392 RepID=A0A839R2L8_9MICO|nr:MULTISPECIES: orotate phosphoribosyltransferase [Helcobacillus]MBB3023216.1 orotate phosphoribosyltransferase [Helcobacillus massiliensis]MCG7428047.1 orotate phosphoribosyltransferase [Helcobacillus sp. ACRRO]MCT1556608.1 orotate phosphoribosyltransferase [Helcobacillus massiliensis]MCT2035802.1 orotate phosphoribosyltransferase [Helcobacillus massiliensis]MCT2331116.1 orotate phosphoribosyltransferase [Helcobacillus massiliensis]